MKKLALLAVLGVTMGVAHASGYYIAGDWQGWHENTTAATEISSGVWGKTLTVGSGLTAGRHTFKFTDGTWSTAYPSSNAWFYAPTSGSVTLTFNTNTISDGASPSQYRVGINDIGGWTAVGDWQSQVGGGNWSNSNSSTTMSKLSGSTYFFDAQLTKGAYSYKAVQTGTWDAIGGDGNGENASNYDFNVTWTGKTRFLVDPVAGTVRAVPEPMSLAVLAIGFSALVAKRRRA